MKELIKNIIRDEVFLNEIRKMSDDKFIEKAKNKHNNFYDYSKVNYVNTRTPVKIICPKHGEFSQNAGSHLGGQGCPKCRYEKSSSKTRMSTDDFIDKSNNIHDNKYTYEKVDYKNSGTKVIVTCPIHGDFTVQPNNHLRGSGCPECYGTKKRTTQEFVDLARKVHGDKYDYSESNYYSSEKPIHIICPNHGSFNQIAANHLKGDECPKCAGNQKSNTLEFISKSKKIHGDRYNYDKVEYSTNKTPVVITCKKPNHGDFTMKPNSHLDGSGCPICSESRGEKFLSILLNELGVEFTRQMKFNDCVSYKNGKKCRRLPFDFYLPKYNTVIEYDGIQHFKEVGFWGGKKSLESQKVRDEIKNKYCRDNGIKIIRIPYTMNDNDIQPLIQKELNL